MNEVGQTDNLIDSSEVSSEDTIEDGKRIVQSRWVEKSSIPRYDKKTADALAEQYSEGAEFHRGARVRTI